MMLIDIQMINFLRRNKHTTLWKTTSGKELP